MNESIEYRLTNVDGMSLDEIDAAIAGGARFVMFAYAISAIAFTFSKPTKIWFVRSDDEARRIARRFSIMTALLGWWGFPHGPIESVRALAVNRGGGVDVTDDVRKALTTEALTSGVVSFSAADAMDLELFTPMTKSDAKDLAKCLRPVLERHGKVNAVWAARIAGPYPQGRE